MPGRKKYTTSLKFLAHTLRMALSFTSTVWKGKRRHLQKVVLGILEPRQHSIVFLYSWTKPTVNIK